MMKVINRLFTCFFLLLLMATCQPKEKTESSNTETMSDSNNLTLFIGTYTRKEGHVDGQGEGIYVYKMDKETGALSYVSTSDEIISPSYLAVHPNGRWVYAVNEFDGGEEEFAAVTALEYDPESRQLTYMTEASSLGQYPCHVSIDNSGNFVMIANYVGGSVVLYPINEEGLITESSSYRKHEGGSDHPRQEAPHAHQIMQHPEKDWVFAVDLGANKIYEYNLDTLSMTLDVVAAHAIIPEESGPRHMAFHPEKPLAYLLNELMGTIEVFPLTESERFERSIQVISTMGEGDNRDAASAAIKVHPNGKFLYASNRGEVNEVVAYAINEDGTLSLVGRVSTKGKTPRDFVIDPSGQFLLVANQDSNNVVTFRIDVETGALIDMGIESEIPTPVCLKFLPSEP